jgi:hypothetical protein
MKYSAIILIIMVICSCGCITAIKTTIAPPIAPTPEPTPIITVKIEPTPVQIYHEPYDLTLYRTNGRYIGDYFKFHRENVSGEKDLTVNTTVYRLDLRKIYFYNARGIGTIAYLPQIASTGWKYAFVFVRMEMEGVNQIDDPRMWGIDSGNFLIQYSKNNNTYVLSETTDHQKCIPIREYENTGNINDDYRVTDYGKFYKHQNAIGVTEDQQCLDYGFLRMGKSNAWDGYIIYQVPDDAQPEDLKLLANMASFGQPYWNLYKNSAMTAQSPVHEQHGRLVVP